MKITKQQLKEMIKETVQGQLNEQHSPDKQRFPTLEEKKATRKLVYDMLHRLRDIVDHDEAMRAVERIMDEISLAAEEHPSVKDQAVEALMLAADQGKWQKVLSFLVNYVPGDAAQHIVDRCLRIVDQFDAKEQKSFDFQSAGLDEQAKPSKEDKLALRKASAALTKAAKRYGFRKLKANEIQSEEDGIKTIAAFENELGDMVELLHNHGQAVSEPWIVSFMSEMVDGNDFYQNVHQALKATEDQMKIFHEEAEQLDADDWNNYDEDGY